MLETLTLITQLESWAPEVLRQGSSADPDDLREILRLRAQVDRDVPEHLDQEQAATFFAMLRADRACSPLSSTLLYLSRGEAEAAVAEIDLTLNSMSWYGIHLWEVTEQLARWSYQLQLESGQVVHPAEAMRALEQLRVDQGREWVNEGLVQQDGFFRTELSPEVLSHMLLYIQQDRAAS